MKYCTDPCGASTKWGETTNTHFSSNLKNLGHSKRILDKLYSKNLNKEIFSRKKQGFALPMNDWLKDKYFENKILECFANHSLLKLDKNFKNILFSTWKLFLSNKIDYEIVWKYYLIDKWIKTNNLNIL